MPTSASVRSGSGVAGPAEPRRRARPSSSRSRRRSTRSEVASVVDGGAGRDPHDGATRRGRLGDDAGVDDAGVGDGDRRPRRRRRRRATVTNSGAGGAGAERARRPCRSRRGSGGRGRRRRRRACPSRMPSAGTASSSSSAEPDGEGARRGGASPAPVQRAQRPSAARSGSSWPLGDQHPVAQRDEHGRQQGERRRRRWRRPRGSSRAPSTGTP